MPKWSWWRLCVAVACLCSSAALASPRITVTFVNPGGATEFWGDVSATMTAAAEDLDIDLNIIHTDRDRLKMVQAAHDAANSEDLPDFFVIVNELQQAPEMLRALAKTKVPVFVLLNRMTRQQRMDFTESGGDLNQIVATITPDNEIAGYEMAQSLIEEARALGLDQDGIQLLALLGDAATPAALAREAGMRRALEEHEDIDLIRAIPVMWNSTTAYERTSAVLHRFTLDAVWSANDQIALGAMRAARDAGKTPGHDLVFAGLNWSDEGLASVEAQEMTLTHGGHFFAGAWSMVMIRDLSDGTLPHGTHVTFPMSAIQSDMAGEFRRLFGSRDWSTIDFGSFTLGRGNLKAYRFSSNAILDASSP